MGYRFDEARQAGVSDTDIVNHLQASGNYTYKFDDAKAAGVSDTEIVNHLRAKDLQTQPNQTLDRMQEIGEQTPEVLGQQPINLQPDMKDAGETAMQDIEDIGAAGEQVIAGARQSVTLPAAKVVDDVLGQLGFEDRNTSTEDLQAITSMINDYNKENPNQLIHPATVGNIVSQMAVPMAKGVKAVAATEAILNTLHGIGQSGNYDTAVKDAVIGGTIGVVAKLGFDKLANVLDVQKIVGPLTKEAQMLIGKNPDGLSVDDAVKLLQDVPREDQVRVLSDHLGHESIGYFKKALDTDADRILLANELKARRGKLLDIVGPVDIPHAKAKYADMVEEVAKDYKSVHDATPILDDINFLEKFYGTTPSKANTVVKQMKTILDENPKINLSDALEFRGDLNYLITKATRGKEKVKLNSIKQNLDKFIDSVATPAQKSQIDDAINTYSRTMNNRDLVALIEKSSKEGRAVDWGKLNVALKDSHLKSPEADMAIKVVEEFSKRFKNDFKLGADTAVKGTNKDSGGVLGAQGYLVNKLKDLAMWGERHDNIKIQNALLASLRNSNTPLEFADEIAKSVKIPTELKEPIANAVRQIEYNPTAKSTGDVGLQPKYVTPRGTTASTPTQATLSEAQTQLVQESLGREVADKVMPTVTKIMEGKRTTNILNQVSSRMKADDVAGNQKMLEKIINSEVDELVKVINKTVGAVLPRSEVEKLYRMKIQELLKDCK